MRPLAVASASSGSGCEVKKGQRVDAAHSSPIQSIGVNGEVSSSTAPTRSISGEVSSGSRSPTARLPTWSWFCRHTTKRQPGVRARSTGRPWLRPRNVE